MSERTPRILFLNQFFPPDPAPTGVLFKDIADVLTAEGFQCSFIAASQDYRDPKKTRKRALRELFALGRILVKGLFAPKPDLVISGSSPPCLAAIGALIARFHRAKSVHWAMDIYPELAVALEEIKAGVPLECLDMAMLWAYRNAYTVVALDEDMATRFGSYGIHAQIVQPWLPATHSAQHPLQQDSDPVWIYSGNLGRAHEWETLLEAQAILEKRGSAMRLVFQGGGAAWPQAQEHARSLGLRQCDWLPYAEAGQLRASLTRARAIVVTQKPETQGLLWPSKLALAMDLPRPILWVGPKGAISTLLLQSHSTGAFEPGDAVGIANWLESLPSQSTVKLRDASAHRQKALVDWRRIVEETAGSS